MQCKCSYYYRNYNQYKVAAIACGNSFANDAKDALTFNCHHEVTRFDKTISNFPSIMPKSDKDLHQAAL